MTSLLWFLLGYAIGIGLGFYGTLEILRMQGRLKDGT